MDSITKPVLCGFCGKEFDYTVYPIKMFYDVVGTREFWMLERVL